MGGDENMDRKGSASRRRFLRRVGLAGGVAIAGGISGSLLSNQVGTIASVIDTEVFAGNLMESGKFELRTAWKLPDETIPDGQTASEFPTDYVGAQSIALPFGEEDPGSKGHVFGAFTLSTGSESEATPSSRGRVDLTASVTPTDTPLVEETTFECWEISDWERVDWENPGPSHNESQRLSSIDGKTILTTACAYDGGFGMKYTLPSAENVLQQITPEDQLSLEITMTASQCATTEQ